MPEPTAPPAVAATNRGWGRVLVLVYGIFALAATGRSTVQLLQKADEAPLAYGLSAFAAVVYIVATWCLARPGPRTTPLAWAAVGVELVGVLVVGTLTVADRSLFPDDTVWSGYGAGYGWVPAVLPFCGLAWLWHTRPRR
ncbi:hypothetical protein [Nocardioides taihuensis]|uniref:Integral membrane protein n=1 Tax=Nocardioides taihuensis TaxID=1835606 RepID=A0ABW0BGC5_9ACTN